MRSPTHAHHGLPLPIRADGRGVFEKQAPRNNDRTGEEEIIMSPQWLTGNAETIRRACRLPVLPDF
jgi:hypothetical protein